MNGAARVLAGLGLSVLLLAAGPVPGAAPLPGVNFAGAEFGAGRLPGRPDTDYVFPTREQLGWAAARGFRLIRLPVLWERLQPALFGPLDPGELGRVRAVADAARALGLVLVLDVHNYGQYRGRPIGDAAVPPAAFADLWRRLATAFRGDAQVIFGLMNEPQVENTLAWRDIVQGAVDAVRATGARNRVLVPGAGWDGAHDFTAPRPGGQPSSAEALAGLRDPAGALLFEVHQYLDADNSGTHPDCPGAERVEALLGPFTAWLRAGGRRGVLGEFAASSRPECLAGLGRMLAFMAANGDVWAGWTYWAAGAWWPADYPFAIEPRGGRDAPQMAVLRPAVP